jgi:uncharacterized membrane-anchored protein YitT (DUF2179 family)
MKINLQHLNFRWETIRDYLFLLLGAGLQAFSLRVFRIPAQLASGGVSGLSQLINHFTGWPIGLMVLIGNIPLLILGWRFLGGPRFAFRTALAVVAFSVLIDLPLSFLPQAGITDDLILNALFGGVVSGIGFGFVYRGRGTSGGSDVLARILNHWRGIPVSQSYLLTDAVVILMAGFVFSWEKALYALIMLYVSGVAAEAISQGSNIVRAATIITNQPQPIQDEILGKLGRGVTLLSAKGGFTEEKRSLLYCVITRAEVNQLKFLVREKDPRAFMVIGQAYEALGEGFSPFEEQ